MLRRAGLGLFVGALLFAPSVATAGPALVFEPLNGTVFYSEDPDAQWFPASLTKLMTAYVTFQALKRGEVKPDTKLTCTQECRRPGAEQALASGGRTDHRRHRAESAHRQIGKRRRRHARRGRGRKRGSLRRPHERGGAEARHDAHPLRQPQRAPRRPPGHLGARPCQAHPRHHRRVPGICRHLRAAERTGRQEGVAHPQPPARLLPRRRRHEDRLHLRFRLQRGGERHPRRQAARCRGARRAVRRHAHRPRRQSAWRTASSVTSGSRCSAPPSTDLPCRPRSSDGPTHLRNVICGAGRAKPTRKRTAIKIKPKPKSAAN